MPYILVREDISESNYTKDQLDSFCSIEGEDTWGGFSIDDNPGVNENSLCYIPVHCTDEDKDYMFRVKLLRFGARDSGQPCIYTKNFDYISCDETLIELQKKDNTSGKFFGAAYNDNYPSTLCINNDTVLEKFNVKDTKYLDGNKAIDETDCSKTAFGMSTAHTYWGAANGEDFMFKTDLDLVPAEHGAIPKITNINGTNVLDIKNAVWPATRIQSSKLGTTKVKISESDKNKYKFELIDNSPAIGTTFYIWYYNHNCYWSKDIPTDTNRENSNLLGQASGIWFAACGGGGGSYIHTQMLLSNISATGGGGGTSCIGYIDLKKIKEHSKDYPYVKIITGDGGLPFIDSTDWSQTIQKNNYGGDTIIEVFGNEVLRLYGGCNGYSTTTQYSSGKGTIISTPTYTILDSGVLTSWADSSRKTDTNEILKNYFIYLTDCYFGKNGTSKGSGTSYNSNSNFSNVVLLHDLPKIVGNIYETAGYTNGNTDTDCDRMQAGMSGFRNYNPENGVPSGGAAGGSLLSWSKYIRRTSTTDFNQRQANHWFGDGTKKDTPDDDSLDVGIMYGAGAGGAGGFNVTGDPLPDGSWQYVGGYHGLSGGFVILNDWQTQPKYNDKESVLAEESKKLKYTNTISGDNGNILVTFTKSNILDYKWYAYSKYDITTTSATMIFPEGSTNPITISRVSGTSSLYYVEKPTVFTSNFIVCKIALEDKVKDSSLSSTIGNNNYVIKYNSAPYFKNIYNLLGFTSYTNYCNQMGMMKSFTSWGSQAPDFSFKYQADYDGTGLKDYYLPLISNSDKKIPTKDIRDQKYEGIIGYNRGGSTTASNQKKVTLKYDNTNNSILVDTIKIESTGLYFILTGSGGGGGRSNKEKNGGAGGGGGASIVGYLDIGYICGCLNPDGVDITLGYGGARGIDHKPREPWHDASTSGGASDGQASAITWTITRLTKQYKLEVGGGYGGNPWHGKTTDKDRQGGDLITFKYSTDSGTTWQNVLSHENLFNLNLSVINQITNQLGLHIFKMYYGKDGGEAKTLREEECGHGGSFSTNDNWKWSFPNSSFEYKELASDITSFNSKTGCYGNEDKFGSGSSYRNSSKYTNGGGGGASFMSYQTDAENHTGKLAGSGGGGSGGVAGDDKDNYGGFDGCPGGLWILPTMPTE